MEGGSSSEPPVKTRRVEKRSVHLTSDQEEAVIGFLKDNPAIYDTRKGDFRQTKLKHAAWANLADTLNVAVEDLLLWYRNMRTQLGKLRNRIETSGAGDEHLTERQRWQWSSLQFLVHHIKKKVARPEQQPTFCSLALVPHFEEENESQGSEEDIIQVKLEEMPTTAVTETDETPTEAPAVTAARLSSPEVSIYRNDLLPEVADLGSAHRSAERSDALLELTHALLQSRHGNREVRSYTDWVYEAIVPMSPDMADDCMAEITAVIAKFKRKMRSQPPVQQQHIPPQQQHQIRARGHLYPK